VKVELVAELVIHKASATVPETLKCVTRAGAALAGPARASKANIATVSPASARLIASAPFLTQGWAR
jgi:hypothetical protein